MELGGVGLSGLMSLIGLLGWEWVYTRNSIIRALSFLFIDFFEARICLYFIFSHYALLFTLP
jgi:hypothetical protein